MKEKLTLLDEFYSLMVKVWAFVLYVLIGFVTLICRKIMNKQKITLVSVLASAGCACFVGFISSVYCLQHAPDRAPYIVPTCTLLSEKIILGLWNMDWKEFVHKLVGVFLGGGK